MEGHLKAGRVDAITAAIRACAQTGALEVAHGLYQGLPPKTGTRLGSAVTAFIDALRGPYFCEATTVVGSSVRLVFPVVLELCQVLGVVGEAFEVFSDMELLCREFPRARPGALLVEALLSRGVEGCAVVR
eukprot:RCo000264